MNIILGALTQPFTSIFWQMHSLPYFGNYCSPPSSNHVVMMGADLFLHHPTLLVTADWTKAEQLPETASHSSSPVFFEMDLGKRVSSVSLMEEVVKWEPPKQGVNSSINCQVEKAGM